MKLFKTFFEDNETIGDIDIYAVPPDRDPQQLGQVNEPGLQTISKFIYKVNKDGDKLIKDLVDQSQFNTKEYHRTFKSVLEEFDIDWGAFAKHVQSRTGDMSATTLKINELFSGKSGQINLKDACQEVLLPLLKDPSDYERFFKELFTLKHSISTTSVGDGEFLLGIIGNGIKGSVGDVDVIIKDSETNQAYEIGGQKKIIGASSRVKGAKGAAYSILAWIKEYTFDAESAWPLEEIITSTYGEQLNEKDVEFIIGQLVLYQDETAHYLHDHPARLVIGSMVLYDYIKQHNDDYIVIVNYSASGTKNMSKDESVNEFDCKFANIKKMTLRAVVRLNLTHKWFKFEIAKDGVRIVI